MKNSIFVTTDCTDYADFQFDGLGDFVVQKEEKGCVNVEKGVKLAEQLRRGSIAWLDALYKRVCCSLGREYLCKNGMWHRKDWDRNINAYRKKNIE